MPQPGSRAQRGCRTAGRTGRGRPPPPPPRPTYPVHGPGTYAWADATSSRIGTEGRLLHYAIRLEDGTNLDLGEISEEIKGILADPRGWTGQGAASFQQVDKAPYDMLISLTSPKTTDALCAQLNAGDTRGEVNCGVAPHLVVNLKRWIELSPQYPGRAHAYRTLIINHEVGHVLGHGHRTCPGPGAPAPAMMQQFYGLKGCTPNPYVYDDNGTLIDGPKVLGGPGRGIGQNGRPLRVQACTISRLTKATSFDRSARIDGD
ncbi:DUF3152 domain-containing protein [Streptomyces sp. NPDC059949]|uniref:DUF3152 domain-containing protein n=1 Tax=Streptomyces sp. NPDC059949 TaxID=3347013 RepID=UPI00364E8A66